MYITYSCFLLSFIVLSTWKSPFQVQLYIGIESSGDLFIVSVFFDHVVNTTSLLWMEPNTRSESVSDYLVSYVFFDHVINMTFLSPVLSSIGIASLDNLFMYHAFDKYVINKISLFWKKHDKRAVKVWRC